MIARLVFSQDQSPDLATAGRGIRTLELPRVRRIELFGVLGAVIPIGPRVAVVVRDTGPGLIDLLRVLDDGDIDHRVATHVVAVMTRLGVRLAVETQARVGAHAECRIHLYDIANGQLQAVEDVIAGRLFH